MEIIGEFSFCEDSCPLLESIMVLYLEILKLLGRNYWSDISTLFACDSNPLHRQHLAKAFYHIIVSTLVHDETLESVTHLTRVGISEEVNSIHHGVEIRISTDDPWSRTSEFHHAADSLFCGDFCESFSYASTPSKSDKIDILIHECISEFSITKHLCPDSDRKGRGRHNI